MPVMSAPTVLPLFDPSSVPIWQEATTALQQQPAVPAAHLQIAALRARFAHPPIWQPEPRETLYVEQCKPAAVLIGLQPHDDGLHVVLTHRTAHLRSHAGQVAFPGGKIDHDDDGPVAAALREAHEEVGLNPQQVDVLGTLTTMPTNTGYEITPVVGLLPADVQWQLNTGEVASLFTVPLTFLMDPHHHCKHQWVLDSGVRREWFSMPYREHYIWGVSAAIVRDVYHFLL